jgi:hypothetical protein
MQVITNTQYHYEASFDGLIDLSEYLKKAKRSKGAGKLATQGVGRIQKWSLGMTYNDAVEMAASGGYWKEGAQNLQKLSANPVFNTDRYTVTESLELDVMGGAIDVGEYLNGAPDCFMRIEEHTPNKKVIRVALDTTSSGTVSAQSIVNRGRAVLAVVDILEAQGISVELNAVVSNADGTGADQHKIYMATCIKKADQQWCAATVAFPLTHPAYPRRLGFRFAESTPSEIATQITGDHSYGYPNILPESAGDIRISSMSGGKEHEYSTPENAMATVVAVVNSQIPDLIKSV